MILKNLMLKILRIYFYFMDYYTTFQKKRIKIWVHRTNSLSWGPNLTPPPQVSCVIQCKKFRNAHFGRFGDVILLVIEVI